MLPLLDHLPPPISQPDAPPRMSEQQFFEWYDEQVRAEWIDGEVQLLPQVTLKHSRTVVFLSCLLGMCVEHHALGKVFGGGYQVRFGELRRRRVPDLCFAGPTKEDLFKEFHFEGGPDLVVEVVSPETQSRDRREKYFEYQAAGVREYWLVDPELEQTELHVLSDAGRYTPVAEDGGRFCSRLLPGFFIRSRWLFAARPAKVLDAFEEVERGSH